MPVCNQKLFSYDSEPFYLIIIMSLGAAMGIYLILRMFNLCFSAFSYSNFHIHQTYKFYAMSLITLAFIIFFHKNQFDFIQFRETQDQFSLQMKQGYQLLYVLFGMISMYSTELLYTLNGLTWLLITFGCDFTADDSAAFSRISTSQYLNTQQLRKQLQTFKVITTYIIFPLLLLISTVGVLKQEETWCEISSAFLLTSSFITMVIFLTATGSFLIKRRKDSTVQLKTKLVLAYLMLAISARQIYFVITIFTHLPLFDKGYVVILLTTFCMLLPLLAMSVLSERQLERQKLLKSSEVFLFKSIVA